MNPPQPAYLDMTYDMFLSSISGEQAESARFQQWVDEVEAADLFAFEGRRIGAQRPEVCMQRTTGTNLSVVNMSSYNYLGYSYHPDVIEAAKAALDQYGLGASSSPVHSGTFTLHAELEAELLDFMDLPNRGVSLFSSGYGVNTGTISALMRRRHHVVMDRAAHMSILEGAQLSRANLHYFEHNDADDLRRVLEEISTPGGRILVCTEGVFSADGDRGDLARIVPVAKEFGAMVLVDEAHSFLVAGPTGRGVAEEAGVLDDVDLFVTTFSKAMGGVGGAVIAKREIARYINWYAKCRMFSCAIAPAVTGGVLQALRLARTGEGQARRQRVWDNSAFLLDQLRGKVDIADGDSWIVPVLFHDEERTLPVLDFLQRNGVDVSILQFPAVPIAESRMRLFATSEHTRPQLERVVEVVLQCARKHGFSLETT
jgi:glycine C-acetyltransferase